MYLLSFMFAVDTMLNSVLFYLVLLFVADCFGDNYLSRKMEDKLKSFMVKLISFFYLDWGYNTYVLYGDYIVQEKCVFVSNHISSCDHGFFLNLVSKFGFGGNISFMAKNNLGNIPILNNLLNSCDTIYVRNGKEKDIENIHYMGRKLSDKPVQTILVFPEGTYISNSEWCKKVKDKNKKLFQNNKKEEFTNVLFPKVTGLSTLVDGLGSNQNKDKVIYDITLCTKDGLKNHTFFNRSKRHTIHLLIRRRVVEEVTQEMLLDWWQEKENQIEYFKKQNEFDECKSCVLGNKTKLERFTYILMFSCINITHYLLMDCLLNDLVYWFLFIKLAVFMWLNKVMGQEL